VDNDENDLPVGLQTIWATAATPSSGKFRVILKHQPDQLKTSTSDSNTGETDLDISFDINVQ
jgi:hypothetical protein